MLIGIIHIDVGSIPTWVILFYLLIFFVFLIIMNIYFIFDIWKSKKKNNNQYIYIYIFHLTQVGIKPTSMWIIQPINITIYDNGYNINIIITNTHNVGGW